MSEEQNVVVDLANATKQSSEEQGELQMTPQEMQEFVSQTHQFVTQLHLEQSAVLNVLLQRGLLTTEELNQAYQQVREGYQQQMMEKQLEAMGIDPSGILQDGQDAEVHKECAVDVCGGGCSEGRQKPQAHGG